MIYINKTTHQIQGDQIINSVLETSWIDDQNQYINANYDDGLCNNQQTFRIELTQVLLENQQYYCCYCMKEITQIDATLEHIIPHNTSTLSEFDTYLVCDELTNNVVYMANFDRSVKLIPPAKYPHDIAYYNLVASCDSNSHCNHYRKNKKIYPFFYDNEIGIKVTYDDAGIAYCDDYKDDLPKLGIGTNFNLKSYRVIWKKLAEVKDAIDDVTNEDIDNIIYELVEQPGFEKLLNNFTGENNNKEVLKKYKWFFHYYKLLNNAN